MEKLISVLITLLLVTACDSGDKPFIAHRVAHAGGGINGETYTNSYDALDSNVKKGFKYFEIDFSFTSDGKLVCIHDWEASFKRSFGFDAKERPSQETFMVLVSKNAKFKKCTLDGLAAWMKNNPGTVLITDVKEDNLRALGIIIRKIPDAERRVIPQIYQPENYDSVRNMGFESIIWTLYRYRGRSNDVLAWVDKFQGAFAITIPVKFSTTQLPAQLARKNIQTYAHTINNRQKMMRLINRYGVTEVYTDFLPPTPEDVQGMIR